MGLNSFWLISIDDDNVVVALLNSSNNRYSVISMGPQKQWNDEDTLLTAVDESLSEAAASISLPEDQEPFSAAFVISPFWIGSDGKIVSTRLKLIENMCRELKLQPSGFIANDEAIVEEANQKDGFPASFIILNVSKTNFTVSLVYLGKIKERIRKDYSDDLTATNIESALLEFNSDSTLPPQIIVLGCVSGNLLQSLKNYSWVGRKDVETFLHFPDIRLYYYQDVINIYGKVISTQLNPVIQSNIPQAKIVEPETDLDLDQEDDIIIEDSGKTDDALVEENVDELKSEEPDTSDNQIVDEVAASELGFVEELPVINMNEIQQTSIPFNLPPDNPPLENNFNKPEKTKLKLPSIKFNFGKQKFSLPKTKFKLFPIIAVIILVCFISVGAIFYLSKAQLTLFVTPYKFSKKINVSLDSAAGELDITKGIIPVDKKTIDINSSVSQKTTGQKTVGEKAKGEIVVYNKQDKSQEIPKGAILIEPGGKKFELQNPVVVASSSSNLEEGVINLGQVKAVVSAADIGPEYNLAGDIKLKFKDYSETLLIAKVSSPFTGGSKRQISAVSEEDRNALSQKINEDIDNNVNTKIDKDLSNLSGLIKGTIQKNVNKIEYSREIGEEADELIATADATVTVFTLDTAKKTQIITGFLSKEKDYEQADIDPTKFEMSFKLTKIDEDDATGQISIDGQALPKTNLEQLKKNLVGKSPAKVKEIIKNNVAKAYNYNLKRSPGFLKSFPIPMKPQNITIEIKAESL